jgi:hypothetical protein
MIKAPVTTDDVNALANSCLLLRRAYIHYHELFEPRNPNGAIFDKIAPFFFGDINRILVIFITLEACKLADPAQDSRGNENLSIEFLVNHTDLAADAAASNELNNRAIKIREFGKKLKPARDKVISHTDRSIALSGLKGLGGVDLAEWDEFWENVDAFIHILVNHYFGNPSKHFILSANSDASRFVETLTQAAGGSAGAD